ncbi:hypothetical protein M422DRAFT_25303 [Sphaerobolus stellatus SS14]|nr:hypothetical protein M422DRAFT_25303 [Sphaerobolus stellatus SS14]
MSHLFLLCRALRGHHARSVLSLRPTFTSSARIHAKSMNAYVQPDPSTLCITSHNQYASSVVLTPTTVSPSPILQFEQWFTEASEAGVKEPEAMSLSTCTKSGIPSSRILLLKQVDARGFVFYTNYTSRKSKELEENPYAALAFHWKEVQRQVRVVGKVEKVSQKESDEYFRSRPLGSRIGAWSSPQSTVVGEDDVARRVEETKQRFSVQGGATEADVPLPDFWGGWRVIPFEVEFWAGKPSRLHDRMRYLREESSDDDPKWKIERLAP